MSAFALLDAINRNNDQPDDDNSHASLPIPTDIHKGKLNWVSHTPIDIKGILLIRIQWQVHLWASATPFLDGITDAQRYKKQGRSHSDSHPGKPDANWLPDHAAATQMIDEHFHNLKDWE